MVAASAGAAADDADDDSEPDSEEGDEEAAPEAAHSTGTFNGQNPFNDNPDDVDYWSTKFPMLLKQFTMVYCQADALLCITFCIMLHNLPRF